MVVPLVVPSKRLCSPKAAHCHHKRVQCENKKQAGDAVNATMECIVTALREGKSVGLPGLGTLSVAQTAERQGVRPGTSERITIPAGRKVRFKVASTLKGNL